MHVNCAMSADGRIAGAERTQVRISSEQDMVRVRALRKRCDAILVGVGTVLADDPHLTVKGLDYDTNPVRIVIDPQGRTPDDALVLNDAAPTVIVTTDACGREFDCEETIVTGSAIDLAEMLERLAEDIGIENLLVEGGGETIAAFFREGLVDRYTVYVGSLIIGGRGAPTPVDGEGWAAEGGVRLRLDDVEVMGDGAVLSFTPVYEEDEV